MWTDAAGRDVVDAKCQQLGDQLTHVALWPRPLEPWIERARRRTALLSRQREGCGVHVSDGAGPVIEGLAPNSTRRLSDHDERGQQVRVLTRSGIGARQWFVNGRYVTSTLDDEPFALPLGSPGRYQLAVVDEAGATDMVTLSVLDF